MSKQIRALCIISEYIDKNNKSAGYIWQIVHPDYLSLKFNEFDASLTLQSYSDCLDQLYEVFSTSHFIEDVVSCKPNFTYKGAYPVVDKFEICFQIETEETK
jgi:hypothetical protein